MQDEKNTNGFQYTYSAKDHEEIQKIRQKYVKAEEDKLSRLRALDAGVNKKGSTVALIVGILGSLILGFGMSLMMSDLAQMLALSYELTLIIGLACGVIGIAMVALAYPLYQRVIKRERERIAPEIIRLTDELSK